MNQHQKSKRFGADAERTVARILQRVWPDAERTGAGMPTKIRSGRDVKNTWPLFVQVKARARAFIWSEYLKVAEAADREGRGELPILMVKVKGAPPLAVVTLDDYLDMQWGADRLRWKREHQGD